jgi:hypothetical protein
MNGPARQQGLTFISFVVLAAIAGFFLLLLMKLGPIYLENYSVKTVLKNIQSEPFIANQPANKIRKQIESRLYINEVRRLSSKDIKMTRKGQKVIVNIDYKVTEHILGNVEAVVTFAESVELTPN